MLAFLRARLEMVALSSSAGLEVQQMAADLVASMSKKMGELPWISVSEANGLMELLNSSMLPPVPKKLAAELVANKTRMHEEPHKPTSALQTCDYFENYLTDPEWEELQRKKDDGHGALHLLANRALKLGLLHPTEQTTKNIVSLKLLYGQQADDARLALQDSRMFKKLLRSGAPGLPQGPGHYPQSPAELQRLHGSLYALAYESGKAGPAPPRCTRFQLLQAQHGTPCRSTKTACRGMPAERVKAEVPPSFAGGLAASLLELLKSGAIDVRTAQQPECPIQLLHPPRRATSFLAVPDSWSSSKPTQVLVPLAQSEAVVATSLPAAPSASLSSMVQSMAASDEVGTRVQEEAGNAPSAPLSTMVHDMQQLIAVKATAKRVKGDDASAKEPPAKRKQVTKRPASHMAEAGPGNSLPPGWSFEEFTRQTGEHRGTIYKVWFSPAGARFRSMTEVRRHLAKGGA